MNGARQVCLCMVLGVTGGWCGCGGVGVLVWAVNLSSLLLLAFLPSSPLLCLLAMSASSSNTAPPPQSVLAAILPLGVDLITALCAKDFNSSSV